MSIFVKPPYGDNLMALSYEKLQTNLEKKRSEFLARVTTRLNGHTITSRIQGELKNKFYDDCLVNKMEEAKLLRHIIDTYYALRALSPDVSSKNPNQIKAYIINNIKFKP